MTCMEIALLKCVGSSQWSDKEALSEQGQLAELTAEPDEEPPGMRSGQAGLRGVPKCIFWPSRLYASSSICVVPISVAPASSRACIAIA